MRRAKARAHVTAMTRGFILLEAIIAVLIIAFVSIFALDGMRIMSATISRFTTAHEATRVRKNALALTRHLVTSGKLQGGTVAYGPYEVRWRDQSQKKITANTVSITQGPQASSFVLHTIVVETTKDGRMIDTFEMTVATK